MRKYQKVAKIQVFQNSAINPEGFAKNKRPTNPQRSDENTLEQET